MRVRSAGKGAFLFNREAPNAEGYGSATLTAIGAKPRVKAMWLRSPGWEFDSLSALWREVSTGTFTVTVQLVKVCAVEVNPVALSTTDPVGVGSPLGPATVTVTLNAAPDCTLLGALS